MYLELGYVNLISWLAFNIFCSPFKRVLIMYAISTIAFSTSQIIIYHASHESHSEHRPDNPKPFSWTTVCSIVSGLVGITCFGKITFFWRKVLLT
jgi:hypothetical protein